MDATTVQEIANQLGIAVDQLSSYIPVYAQTQITSSIVAMTITFGIFLIALIIDIILYKRDFETAYFVSFCIAALAFITLFFEIIIFIPYIIEWSICPEITFMKMFIPK